MKLKDFYSYWEDKKAKVDRYFVPRRRGYVYYVKYSELPNRFFVYSRKEIESLDTERLDQTYFGSLLETMF
jgi:hypothetical protein